MTTPESVLTLPFPGVKVEFRQIGLGDKVVEAGEKYKWSFLIQPTPGRQPWVSTAFQRAADKLFIPKNRVHRDQQISGGVCFDHEPQGAYAESLLHDFW